MTEASQIEAGKILALDGQLWKVLDVRGLASHDDDDALRRTDGTRVSHRARFAR